MNSESSPYQPPRSAITPTAPIHFGELKIFSARGRLGRVRYIGYSMGLMLLTYLAMAVLGGAAIAMSRLQGGSDAINWLGSGVLIVVGLTLFIASILLTIQRLHDFDASGWWALLMLAPFANMVLYLVLLIMPGTQGPNRFDHPPPPNTVGVILLALIPALLAVIGIVAAIAIPAFNDYKGRAQTSQQAPPQQP
jgi:uncharacterized membrane protein YhaH (DUF805 family)